MQEVVLGSVSPRRSKDPASPPGHATLAAAMRQDGAIHVNVVLLDTGSPMKEQLGRILDAVEMTDDEPWIALGAYVFNERVVRELLLHLRCWRNRSRIVLGGPSISFTDAGQLETNFPGADYFIRGYAEAALVQLVASD